MRFFLIGFMGSGKSFWGRRLSQHLGMPFVDLDEYIETGEQSDIQSIFTQQGEDHFRELEVKYLQALVEQYDDVIVATGGGTPCHHDLMSFMHQQGISIYLEVPVDILFERLLHERETRPLLKAQTESTVRDYIEKKLAEREAVYRKATHIVDAASADLTTFDRIFKAHV